MTVKELKNVIEKFDDNKEVVIAIPPKAEEGIFSIARLVLPCHKGALLLLGAEKYRFKDESDIKIVGV